jgi:hypothetical protein
MNVTAATNTHATIELLSASFSMMYSRRLVLPRTSCCISYFFPSICYTLPLSKLTQEVTLQICIWGVTGSNLVWDIDYTDWNFPLISFDLPNKWRDSTLNYTTTASFHILTKSLFTTIQSFNDICIIWVAGSVVYTQIFPSFLLLVMWIGASTQHKEGYLQGDDKIGVVSLTR